MGADHDAVQRAIVFGIAVVSAGLYGAFNALIRMAVHDSFLLLIGFGISMAPENEFSHGKDFLKIAFCRLT